MKKFSAQGWGRRSGQAGRSRGDCLKGIAPTARCYKAPRGSVLGCLSMLLLLAAADRVAAQGAATVTESRRPDVSHVEYRVDGAQGPGEDGAARAALFQALQFASEQFSADPTERARIRTWVGSHGGTLQQFGTPGRVTQRTFAPDGVNLRITNTVMVDVEGLRRALEQGGVVATSQDMARAIGNPTFLVVNHELINDPTATNGPDGILIDSEIGNVLASQQWNLVNREAMMQAVAQREAISNVSGIGVNPVAQLATIAGADCYLDYALTMQQANGRVQARVSITVFDTVTAQQLASAPGQSQEYPIGQTTNTIMLQQAVRQAMTRVQETVRGYWAQMATQGRRYRFIIQGDFADSARYRPLRDAMRQLGEVDMNRTETELSGTLTSSRDRDDVTDAIEDGLNAAGFSSVRPILTSRALFVYQARMP